MHVEKIEYSCDKTKLTGYLFHNPKIKEKRPAVLVAHAWRGLDDFAKLEAQRLASMGYIVFAADMYGNTNPIETDDEARSVMLPLFLDRQLLQKRIGTAFNLISHHPLVDQKRVGAIGFCFGGLTVIELLRSGLPVRGVVSFHGVLGKKMGDKIANTVPIASGVKGSILVLHGHEDPLVSHEDIQTFQNEMTDAHIDWQMVIYGHTFHAFTNPEAPGGSSGLNYNEVADRRSWTAMRDFFDEIFKF